MLRLALLVASAVTLTACGAIGGSSSCDFRTSGANGAEPRCQERVGTLTTEAFKAACKVAQGVSADGACPRTGSVGGCFIGAQGDGSKVNDWYYAPMTADDVKSECSKDGATFLTP
jgi:hypothetical protein